MNVIKDKRLAHPAITHGFFGCRGGVSNGIYTALNCGAGTKDSAENVAENRSRVCAALDIQAGNLRTLYQIHSAECRIVTKDQTAKSRPEADAMVTDIPGLALGILTADCAPVLFYGQKENGAPVIGASHAGWGGALKGVLENTIAKMLERGALKNTIHAAIGPCIALESYEVSKDFKAPFFRQDPFNERFFAPAQDKEHLKFDLSGYVMQRLRLSGISKIGNTAIDTYAHDTNYFSYRRSTHKNEADYGRQISVIAIKD